MARQRITEPIIDFKSPPDQHGLLDGLDGEVQGQGLPQAAAAAVSTLRFTAGILPAVTSH